LLDAEDGLFDGGHSGSSLCVVRGRSPLDYTKIAVLCVRCGIVAGLSLFTGATNVW
jgi:hypothetical protein